MYDNFLLLFIRVRTRYQYLFNLHHRVPAGTCLPVPAGIALWLDFVTTTTKAKGQGRYAFESEQPRRIFLLEKKCRKCQREFAKKSRRGEKS